MENEEKAKLLNQAILFQREVSFDYISADMSVKFGRRMKPIEVKGKWVYGHDDGKLKRFLIDGLQKLEVLLPKT